jgi:hypothetical protein
LFTRQRARALAARAAAFTFVGLLAACASEPPTYGPPVYSPPYPPAQPSPSAPAPYESRPTARSAPAYAAPAGSYGGGGTAASAWRDDAHRRDRTEAVDGLPEFAAEEAHIRAEMDAGVREGWLDRNDFLIFGRQLHQTELHEARQRRLHGSSPPRAERVLIRNNLDELRRQLDDTRDHR